MSNEPASIAVSSIADDDLLVLDDLSEGRAPGGGLNDGASRRPEARADREAGTAMLRGGLVVGTRHLWRIKGAALVRRFLACGLTGVLLLGIVFVALRGWSGLQTWLEAKRGSDATLANLLDDSIVVPSHAEKSPPPAVPPLVTESETSVERAAGDTTSADLPPVEPVSPPVDSTILEPLAEPLPDTARRAPGIIAVAAGLEITDGELWNEFWGEATGLFVSPATPPAAPPSPREEAESTPPVASEAAEVSSAVSPTTGVAAGPMDTEAENSEPVDSAPVEVIVAGDNKILLYKDETIVELKNGNYFKGKIKKLSDDAITLYYDKGEYTFSMLELKQIVPPGSREYLPLDRFPEASVCLANGSRFRGRVIKDDEEKIVVGYPAGRLTFRRADVREIDYLSEPSARVLPVLTESS
ncbi:MAG: hypothetical protein AB1486_07555 [Planctomycetota bacterium]